MLNHTGNRPTAVVFGALAVLACTACAGTPQRSAGPAPVSERAIVQVDGAGGAAAAHAQAMLNAPYRYGGTTPATGFDCSGLVQYSYRQAGVTVPRSTEEQRRASRLVRVAALQPGDLVFFDQEGKKNSHVGIYLGGLQFIHAPSSGKRVRKDRLDSPYWRKHLSEARRFSG